MSHSPTKRGRPQIQELTDRQAKTFKAIRDFFAEKGQPPTQKELARRMNVSSGTVFASIRQLIRKGYLKQEPNKWRSLTIAREPQDHVARQVQIPILGDVAAGRLQFAEENLNGTVTVDEYLVQHGTYFGLKVVGDSMKNAGILEGDIVIVRHQPLAEDGDIVVACVGEEATVKRLRYSPKQILLEPENDAYAPIEIRSEQADQFRIVGRVVALVRAYRESPPTTEERGS